MKYLGVIPARLGSTRLQRKPLQPLLNKPLILWVCEAVQKSKLLDMFVVATDSQEIFDVVTQAGFKAQMTSENCPSGTDRVLEVAERFKADYILNIQGDEPLIDPNEIDELAKFINEKDEDCWATLGFELSSEDLNNLNAVKVVLGHNDQALYFSRFPIPFSRGKFEQDSKSISSSVLKHVGLYAYTSNALKKFCNSEPTQLEKSESLEQLRALQIGSKVFVKQTAYQSLGVDTLEDLKKVENVLKKR